MSVCPFSDHNTIKIQCHALLPIRAPFLISASSPLGSCCLLAPGRGGGGEKEIRLFIKRYCNDLDIKLVFSSFKIGNMFSVKDPVPVGLRSRVVYKFACAGCNACYVDETTRHFSTRVREHLVSDRASHIFKHLQNSEHCRTLCSQDCFHILDHTSTSFQLKIKEAFHIHRVKPSLNQQLYHVNLKLSL